MEKKLVIFTWFDQYIVKHVENLFEELIQKGCYNGEPILFIGELTYYPVDPGEMN